MINSRLGLGLGLCLAKQVRYMAPPRAGQGAPHDKLHICSGTKTRKISSHGSIVKSLCVVLSVSKTKLERGTARHHI